MLRIVEIRDWEQSRIDRWSSDSVDFIMETIELLVMIFLVYILDYEVMDPSRDESDSGRN